MTDNWQVEVRWQGYQEWTFEGDGTEREVRDKANRFWKAPNVSGVRLVKVSKEIVLEKVK